MQKKLAPALLDPLWGNHLIGDRYTVKNAGKIGDEEWLLAYYPLFGTYEGPAEARRYVEFAEPRFLMEKRFAGGTDFREVPGRFITKMVKPGLGPCSCP